MRVLQLINRRQRRGAEIFAMELSDILVGRGHDVLMAGIYPPRGTPLVPERAAYQDLDATEVRLFSPSAASQVARIIRQFQPDIVQANGSDTLKYTALAASPSRRPWRLVYRNISVASRWLRGPLHRALNRRLVDRVDHVVAVSRASGEDFIQTYRVDAARLSVIPQAAHVPAVIPRDRARAALVALTGISGDAKLVIHAGSFSPEKNHAWLLDAFRRVRARHPDAHLVLLGDGPLRADIEARVAVGDLGGAVHVLGSRSDAPELFAGADLLVLPSLVEGLPGVVLEAAAHAVPAVANHVGGVPEVVIDGETGTLVQPGDMEAFVDAIDALLAHPDRREALGTAARQLVLDSYDLERIAGDYETLYDSLLRRRAAA